MRASSFLIAGSATALIVLLAWNFRAAAPPVRSAPAVMPSGDFVIRAVRVFDGGRVHERADVVVRAGRIVSLATDAGIDPSLPVVEGEGLTLLPGLIDAHVHAFGDARRDALREGVTTLVDQFGDWKLLAAARAERESLLRTDQADLWGAGTLATADGGHGTQFGLPVPPLGGPEQAGAWVNARLAEGSDFIKIVREDAKLYRPARPLPTLDRATAAAAIRAAHAQGRKAVMHVSTREHAREAFEDGVDGIVHVFHDAPADTALVDLLRERRGFVVATLAVIDGSENLAAARAASAQAATAVPPPPPSRLRDARTSVRALNAAGVPILAGSDAPNLGLRQGAALHAELAHLVAAGLTPTQALIAATSAPASAFGIPERGRITAGARADLLLVRGDPSRDIHATRDIVGVWKNGFVIDRERAAGVAVPDLKGEPVSDFERDLGSRYGAGWSASSDRMMGGKSTARIARSTSGARGSAGASGAQGSAGASGAQGSAGALRVEGAIAAGFAHPWAGATFSPGPAAMRAVDYSQHRELRLRVRGDGRRYQAMLLSGSGAGGAPPSQAFETGADWREVRMPLSDFKGADLKRVWGIGFSATAPAGAFWFELDDVAIETSAAAR